jgi:hypothetical protein
MKMGTFEFRMHDNSDYEKTACKFFLKKINFGRISKCPVKNDV